MTAPSPLGLHLFLGPDRPRKLQRIQELERALAVDPLDRHLVDGSTIPGEALLALCRQRPAASPGRLIVVDEAHKLDARCAEALLAKAPVLAQSACVVLLIDKEPGSRHPLARPDAGRREDFPGRDTPAAKPFALIEALGMRDASGALSAVHDQLRDGKDPLELLGLITWQVQRWVAVRRLMDRKVPLEEIAAAAGLRPWQAQRIQREVASRPLGALQALLARCWQVEGESKTGRAIPLVAVEQLILELCAPETRSGPARQRASLA